MNCARDKEFFIVDTGHDVFIGQEWLTEQEVWLHPKTRAFHWPDHLSKLAQFSPVILVDDRKRKLDKKAQADMERREELMKKEEQQIRVRRI